MRATRENYLLARNLPISQLFSGRLLNNLKVVLINSKLVANEMTDSEYNVR